MGDVRSQSGEVRMNRRSSIRYGTKSIRSVRLWPDEAERSQHDIISALASGLRPFSPNVSRVYKRAALKLD